MGCVTEPRLVVKRTFLEFVECSSGSRPRSLTDSAISFSSEEMSPRPLGEAFEENKKASEKAIGNGRVNESATEELKAFLGLGGSGEEKENAGVPRKNSLVPPSAMPILEEEQTPTEVISYWAETSNSAPQNCMTVWMPFDYNSQYMVSNVQVQWEEPIWAAPMQPRNQAISGKMGKAADAYANSEEIPDHLRTTVIMRNIPNNYTRDMLLDLLDSEGFACKYDFVYLPVDFNTQAGLGYAFIDLVSPEWAQAFWSHFDGFRGWTVPSEKVCALNWSCPLQGLEAHIERYRNSPVMHPAMSDEWKPVLYCNGERLVFPPPTKPIKAPKIRSRPQ